jgi:hypothetical protein
MSKLRRSAGGAAQALSNHCLASILSNAEVLKKDNVFNVCVVKNHYYESAGVVTTSGNYSVSQFNGVRCAAPMVSMGDRSIQPVFKEKSRLIFMCVTSTTTSPWIGITIR